jgi:hypothetical protein
MQLFNQISSAIFDVLLTPFGHEHALFDMLVWPSLMGVLAILVYKLVSNQSALTQVKSQIAMRLLEIRLFSHDIGQVLKSTGMILVKNMLYLGNHMLPMLVMFGPFVVIMAQLVANYGYDPSPRGSVELLHVRIDPESGLSSRDVTLELPDGISLDAAPVQTADFQVFWRLRADKPGDHVLSLTVGEDVFDKGWAVGGEPRKVPVKRLRSLEAILYPGEAALPADGPLLSIELGMHPRELGPLPAGELGIVLWVLIVSLAAGFAVKGLFGVTI